MLRDVALEHGVDEELYDQVIHLRRIAAGCQADALDAPKPNARRRSSNGGTRRRSGQRTSA